MKNQTQPDSRLMERRPWEGTREKKYLTANLLVNTSRDLPVIDITMRNLRKYLETLPEGYLALIYDSQKTPQVLYIGDVEEATNAVRNAGLTPNVQGAFNKNTARNLPKVLGFEA